MTSKKVVRKIILNTIDVGISIGVGYLYFTTFRKVSPVVKFMVLMACNEVTKQCLIRATYSMDTKVKELKNQKTEN